MKFLLSYQESLRLTWSLKPTQYRLVTFSWSQVVQDIERGLRNALNSLFTIIFEDKFSFFQNKEEKTPPKKYRGPRSPNNGQGAALDKGNVESLLAWGSAQMAFESAPAVQIGIRAARTSQKAYVRLLLSHLHGNFPWGEAPPPLRMKMGAASTIFLVPVVRSESE